MDLASLTPPQLLALHGSAPARYYIVWITQLVPSGDGGFNATLDEVTFLH